MRSTPAEAQSLIPDLLGDVAARAYAELYGAPLESVIFRTRIDSVPNPDSRVTLSDRRDALGMPRVRLDWRLEALDYHSARRALEIVGAEVGRAGIGRVRVTLDDPSKWPEDLAGGYHHMGTTRMSNDPHRGVVNRNGRVHGVRNLFVAGSSVFPTAGSGTPTLTIVALALRLAERLKRALS
jgi:choline dehydrogenase-like flavoprotein